MEQSQATSHLAKFVVETGLVSEYAVQTALRELGAGLRLSELIVQRGLVAADKLAQALSYHRGVPWVSLKHVYFSPQLLDLIPSDVARQYGVIPVYVRHANDDSGGRTLYVATDDPTNSLTAAVCARASGLPVRVMVATAPDVTEALEQEYGVPGSFLSRTGISSIADTAPTTTDAMPVTVNLAAGRRARAATPAPLPSPPALDDIDMLDELDPDDAHVSHDSASLSADSQYKAAPPQTDRSPVYPANMPHAPSDAPTPPEIHSSAPAFPMINHNYPTVLVVSSVRDFARRCRLACRRLFIELVVQAPDVENVKSVSFGLPSKPVVLLAHETAYQQDPVAWSCLAVELGCALSVVGPQVDGERLASFVELALAKSVS